MKLIRNADIEDIPALIKLVKDGFDDSNFGTLHFDVLKTADFLFSLIERGQFLKVYVDTGEIVGVMAGEMFCPFYSNDKLSTDKGLFVDKAYRGGKVAGLLIESFIQWSKDKGVKQIRPGISTGMVAAAKVFTDLGFDITGHNFLMEV